MPQTEEEYRKTLESEKARVVVLLGFLSIILTVRVELHDGDFWNFPWWCGNSCVHFTVWLLPTFTNWIALWLGYIVCMLVYVSEDRLDKYSWSRTVRELARRIGTRFFVMYYPLTVLFFSGFGGISFQLPDLVQTPYWLAVSALFGFYMIWTAEGMLGAKIIGKRGMANRSIRSFLELGAEGMTIISGTLVHVWRRLLRRPMIGPVDVKRTMRIFLSVIMVIVVITAWGIYHLFGYDLLEALGIPLYAVVFASTFIGWYSKRRTRAVKSLD